MKRLGLLMVLMLVLLACMSLGLFKSDPEVVQAPSMHPILDPYTLVDVPVIPEVDFVDFFEFDAGVRTVELLPGSREVFEMTGNVREEVIVPPLHSFWPGQIQGWRDHRSQSESIGTTLVAPAGYLDE